MPRRYYSNTAVPTMLSAAVTNTITTITPASKTGYPTSFPFTVTLDRATASLAEAVEVTANSGSAWTVVRGVDGTTAAAHVAGAPVNHDHTARDYTEIQELLDNANGFRRHFLRTGT